MSGDYFWGRLMPISSAILQIKFWLSPGDGLEGLHSRPAWF
jgi:hypothetical protein